MAMTEATTGTQPTPTPTEGPPAGKEAAEPEEYPYLSPIIRQAIRAYERELPRLREELLARGCTEKEWVAFHGDKYLGHARKQYDLLQKYCEELGVSERDIYCGTLLGPIRRAYLTSI